ncbi:MULTISPECIES: hypothetical protein [unclassified Wolbachia]|uniref:hypothetical protein n=1 Tax=unclassified Wolbachia TaxID=2640676 RepID=UPI000AF5A20A|nr:MULTISPECIES: hypothetical protein [unclassified Wolbachia]
MSGQRPYDVIQVADTGSFMMMSSQCLTLGSSPSIIIKTLYFNVKQLFLYSPT